MCMIVYDVYVGCNQGKMFADLFHCDEVSSAYSMVFTPNGLYYQY